MREEFVKGFFDSFGVVGWDECDGVVCMGFDSYDGGFDQFVLI